MAAAHDLLGLFLILMIWPKQWDPTADARDPPGLGETNLKRDAHTASTAAVDSSCVGELAWL
jgi:hypothetical protein